MNSRAEEIRTKLETAKYELLKSRNVVATGIGYKTVAGKATSELSIICSVDVKKPKKPTRQKRFDSILYSGYSN